MIVVLDTTVFSSDFTCSGTAWRVLAHASKAWDIRVIVPEVVVAEAVSGYRREMSHLHQALDKPAAKYAGRLGLRDLFEDLVHDLEELGDGYPKKLADTIAALGGVVMPPPDVPHMELAGRAAARRKPCDHNGDGFRDTLNWLLVLDIAQQHPNTPVFWVTGNSVDFADDDKQGFHPDLLEDLVQIGAQDRVHWTSDLASLLLSLAKSHQEESAEDLRRVKDLLEREAITSYIETVVLPAAVGRPLAARQCALPRASVQPEILAVQGVSDIACEVRGSADSRGAFAEFSLSATTLVGLDLASSEGDLPSGVERMEDGRRAAAMLKVLRFGGLIELDSYGRPVSGDVSTIAALADDPDLKAWRHGPGDVSAILAGIESIRRASTISPEVLEALRPRIDPSVFSALTPNLDRIVQDLTRSLIVPDLLAPVRAALSANDILPRTMGLMAGLDVQGPRSGRDAVGRAAKPPQTADDENQDS